MLAVAVYNEAGREEWLTPSKVTAFQNTWGRPTQELPDAHRHRDYKTTIPHALEKMTHDAPHTTVCTTT
jgi:hypothetical protein